MISPLKQSVRPTKTVANWQASSNCADIFRSSGTMTVLGRVYGRSSVGNRWICKRDAFPHPMVFEESCAEKEPPECLAETRLCSQGHAPPPTPTFISPSAWRAPLGMAKPTLCCTDGHAQTPSCAVSTVCVRSLMMHQLPRSTSRSDHETIDRHRDVLPRLRRVNGPRPELCRFGSASRECASSWP